MMLLMKQISREAIPTAPRLLTRRPINPHIHPAASTLAGKINFPSLCSLHKADALPSGKASALFSLFICLLLVEVDSFLTDIVKFLTHFFCRCRSHKTYHHNANQAYCKADCQ